MKLNILRAESWLGLTDCSMACKETAFASDCKDFWGEVPWVRSHVFMSTFVQVYRLFFFVLCGGTYQFITFHGFIMHSALPRKGKLELNPSGDGERESHPPIILKERSAVLPTLRPRINIHHQTFVKFNIICLQQKEQIGVSPPQIFLRTRAAVGTEIISLVGCSLEHNRRLSLPCPLSH